MNTTTTTSRRDLADTTPRPNAPKSTTAAGTLSLRRLNVMRIGYLVMGVGLAVTKWPLLINRTEPWPLMEGVATYMLVAMGLLALLGLRYPVKMLPSCCSNQPGSCSGSQPSRSRCGPPARWTRRPGRRPMQPSGS